MRPSESEVKDFCLKVAQHLPLETGDDSLIVLKGHLLCEEYINEYLREVLSHAEHLEKAKLPMTTKITLCKAASDDERHDKWIWKGVEKLNSLRNSYAHALVPNQDTVSKRKESFITYVQQQNLPRIPLIEANKLALNIVLLCTAIYSVLGVLQNEQTQ